MPSWSPVPNSVAFPTQFTEATRKFARLLLCPEATRLVFGRTSAPLPFWFTCILYPSISSGIANLSTVDDTLAKPWITDAAEGIGAPLAI